MTRETITLTQVEQRQLMVLSEIRAGRLSAKQASQILGLSLRHCRRLLAVFRRKGAAALAHGNRGRPDRHGIITNEARPRPLTVEEQLRGRMRPLTQVGRALHELGIQWIRAHSPQAKGRVERLWGTFQDRLVSELRLAGAGTLEEANAVLQAFLPRYNVRFTRPAAQPGSAYRPLPTELNLDDVCFHL